MPRAPPTLAGGGGGVGGEGRAKPSELELYIT